MHDVCVCSCLYVHLDVYVCVYVFAFVRACVRAFHWCIDKRSNMLIFLDTHISKHIFLKMIPSFFSYFLSHFGNS